MVGSLGLKALKILNEALNGMRAFNTICNGMGRNSFAFFHVSASSAGNYVGSCLNGNSLASSPCKVSNYVTMAGISGLRPLVGCVYGGKFRRRITVYHNGIGSVLTRTVRACLG